MATRSRLVEDHVGSKRSAHDVRQITGTGPSVDTKDFFEAGLVISPSYDRTS